MNQTLKLTQVSTMGIIYKQTTHKEWGRLHVLEVKHIAAARSVENRFVTRIIKEIILKGDSYVI